MVTIRERSHSALFVYDKLKNFRLIDNPYDTCVTIPVWAESDGPYLLRSLKISAPANSTILMHGEKVVAANLPFGAGFFESGTEEIGTDGVIDALRTIARRFWRPFVDSQDSL